MSSEPIWKPFTLVEGRLSDRVMVVCEGVGWVCQLGGRSSWVGEHPAVVDGWLVVAQQNEEGERGR